MSTFGSRFRTARLAANLSQRSLARQIGLTGSAISQWESGATAPDHIAAHALEKAAKLLNVTVHCLLTGQRASRVNEPATGWAQGMGIEALRLWRDPADLPPDRYFFFARLDIYLSAGLEGLDLHPIDHLLDRELAVRAEFAAQQGWTAYTHFAMTVRGDSMEPTIQHDAPVLVAVRETKIESGRIYAIAINGGTYLKRLDKLPGGQVRVRSDNTLNPAYAPYEVPESDLNVIGRVVFTRSLL